MIDNMSEFQVLRSDLKVNRIVDGATADTPLAPDEVLLKVERFAFTANNVTYGVAGDQIGYWQFFPPAGGDSDWGILPVWRRVHKRRRWHLPRLH